MKNSLNLESDKCLIWNYYNLVLSPYRLKIVVIFFSMVASSVISFFIPIVNRSLIDEGLIGGRNSIFVSMLLLSLILQIFSHLLAYFDFVQFNSIYKELYLKLSDVAYQHLLRLPIEYFKKNNEAQILNNLSADVRRVASIADNVFVQCFIQLFCLVGSLIGLIFINTKLVLIVLLIIPLKMCIMQFSSCRRELLTEKYLNTISGYGKGFGDTIRNIETVKLWNLYTSEVRKHYNRNYKVILTIEELAYLGKQTELLNGLVNIAITTIVYYTSYRLLNNEMLTVGEFFAFFTYLWQVLNSAGILTRIKCNLSEIKPSFKRYIDFVNIEEERDIEGYLKRPAAFDKIVFDNVGFGYGCDTKVFNDLTFELKKGVKVVISGHNGSGKSSLVNLLLRFYTAETGRIMFGDINISYFLLDEYREYFSVVPQSPKLFDGTIRENIDLRNDLTDNQIIEILNKWGLSGLLNELDDGLDTKVGAEGTKISGGERQKVALARALCKKAKVLILDEATSNLDTGSKNIFLETLLKCEDYELVILITHDRYVIEKMGISLKLESKT